MDFDRCIPSQQRYYDPWYNMPAPYPPHPAVRAEQHDYPSPAPSDPSPAPRTDLYPLIGPFSPLESAIGPARTARRLRHGAHARRSSTSAGLPSLSPSLYQPGTPISMSPFSQYDQSRTRSDSLSDSDHRAHSPALSSASGRSLSATAPPAESRNLPAAHVAPPPRPTRKRHNKHKLRDQDRKAICIYHIDHPNARQEDIGTVFGVERSTISKILKDKDRWLKICDDDLANDQNSRHRPSKFPDLESDLRIWLKTWRDQGANITDHLIRTKALEIAKDLGMGLDKFKGSSGWIENFKHRHDIRRGEWFGLDGTETTVAPPGGAASGSSSAALAASSSSSSNMPLSSYDSRQSSSHFRNNSWDSTSSNAHDSSSGGLIIDPSLQSGSSSALAPIQHSPTITYGVHYGPPLLPARDTPPVPTLSQAEDAMNVLLGYLDHHGHQIVKPGEREVLNQIKIAMFQHANGIPYERP